MGVARWVLGTSTILAVGACSGPPSAPSGAVDLPRSSAPATPNRQPLFNFEGTVDVARGTVDIVTRSPSGAIQTSTTLPYGTAPGDVYFHTCSVGYSTSPSLTYGGGVTAINLTGSTVTAMNAVIDSISETGVTLATGPGAGATSGIIASYGNVPANSVNCTSPTMWKFNLPGPASFTFAGHADAAPILTPPSVPASGLLARWKLNDGSGATAADSSGNGHTAALTNVTWQSGANCLLGACAQLSGTGGAGTGSYLQFGSALPVSTTGISFAAWVRLTSPGTGTYQTIFNGPTSPCCTYRLLVDNNFHPYWNAGTHTDINPAYVFPAAQWIHVAFTIQGGSSAILYVNGVSVATSSGGVPASLPGLPNFEVGIADGFQWPGKARFNDVLIYNRVLTPAEISNLYGSY